MTTGYEQSVLHVHVDNEVKTAPVSTEEHYAEHFTCSTFTLPQGEIVGTGVGAIEPTQILNLDPLRQRAVLSFNGSGQVILAHSVQQVTSLAQNVQQAADEGALVTCPATMTVEATGPLWAVGVAGSQNVTVGANTTMVSGALASPVVAGTTIATTGTLPAGVYNVTATNLFTGAPTFADVNNINLKVGATVIGPLPASGASEVSVTSPVIQVVVPAGGATISTAVNGVGSGAAGYNSVLTATQVSSPTGSVAVGVTQERRSS